MSVINTNVKSLVAQNALASNNRALSKTMEQLSTGKRVNNAADDAAGLAISNKMTSQIRGLNQAVRNANDSVSLLQTAEGAMVEITNMMQRMRELAVQSANDTNTTEDRGYLDLEFQQLKEEVNRITNNTQWNGMNVLDASFVANGDAGKFVFQVGANGGTSHTISHTIDQLGFSSAGTGAQVSATGAATSIGTVTVTAGAVAGFVEGDVISVKIGDDLLQYKVSAADIAAVSTNGTTPQISESIAAGIQSVFQTLSSQEGRFSGFTASVTGNAVKINKADGTAIGAANLTVNVKSGSLAALDSLSITGRTTSVNAVNQLDTAIRTVNESRAEIGSVINRLNFAADNLANVSMNTSASRSRILDTDYAQATTELARTQIIQQAATAMLAQANQQPASVLSLLQ